MSDSAEDLQSALYAYDDYCRRWKMHVNYYKTKILIFSKGKNKGYLNCPEYCDRSSERIQISGASSV